MVKAFIMIKLGSSEYMGLTESALEKLSEMKEVGSTYAVLAATTSSPK